MKIDRMKFLHEIETAHNEQTGKGGSAWNCGIEEGFRTILDISEEIFADTSVSEKQVKDRFEQALKINETIEAWRGSSSCLG